MYKFSSLNSFHIEALRVTKMKKSDRLLIKKEKKIQMFRFNLYFFSFYDTFSLSSNFKR